MNFAALLHIAIAIILCFVLEVAQTTDSASFDFKNYWQNKNIFELDREQVDFGAVSTSESSSSADLESRLWSDLGVYPRASDKIDALRPPEGSSALDVIRTEMLTRTGTTIVGLACKEGIVLGADTRTTGGPIVVNKHKCKIQTLSPTLFMCTAGTVADCDHITKVIERDLASKRSDQQLAGVDADGPGANAGDTTLALLTLRRFMRSDSASGNRRPEAAFILGGIEDGQAGHLAVSTLYKVTRGGLAQRCQYCALGSGSAMAYSALESQLMALMQQNGSATRLGSFAQDSLPITLDQAVDIVRQAVRAGIRNDLGSGSHIDLVSIQRGAGARKWREHQDLEGTPADDGRRSSLKWYACNAPPAGVVLAGLGTLLLAPPQQHQHRTTLSTSIDVQFI